MALPPIGAKMAYRERAKTVGGPLRPAKVPRHGPPSRAAHVRVRWLDGEFAGLGEWIPAVRLIAPCDESTAILEDERRLLQAIATTGDVHDTTAWKTVEEVFVALPRGWDLGLGYRAYERDLLLIMQFEDTTQQADLDRTALLAAPGAYVDRHGDYHAPFAMALQLAQHFCRSQATPILRRIQAAEDAIRQAIISGHYTHPDGDDGFAVDQTRAEAWLEEERPVWELVRSWCGVDMVRTFDQVAGLQNEIKRLEGLVEEAAQTLQIAGHPGWAKDLLAKLRGQPSASRARRRKSD